MTDLSVFSQLKPKTRMATDFEQNNHNRWGVSSSGSWSAVPSLGGLQILISRNFWVLRPKIFEFSVFSFQPVRNGLTVVNSRLTAGNLRFLVAFGRRHFSYNIMGGFYGCSYGLMTSRNVKYGFGKKHLKPLFFEKKHLKNWNPRFGHSNDRMEALGKHHICLLDPNTMDVPLTNLNLGRESVWCGLKCDLDAFLSSALPQILLRWQNIRQILVDQKNWKNEKRKKHRDTVAFPLFAGDLSVQLWHRDSFLSVSECTLLLDVLQSQQNSRINSSPLREVNSANCS